MRIGRDSTYSLIRSGKIPSIRIGRQIRVPRAALLRHLEREAEEAVTAPAAEEALSGA